MAIKTENKSKNESSEKKGISKKRVSKTWLAILEHKDNGEILDLKAVLK